MQNYLSEIDDISDRKTKYEKPLVLQILKYMLNQLWILCLSFNTESEPVRGK